MNIQSVLNITVTVLLLLVTCTRESYGGPVNRLAESIRIALAPLYPTFSVSRAALNYKPTDDSAAQQQEQQQSQAVHEVRVAEEAAAAMAPMRAVQATSDSFGDGALPPDLVSPEQEPGWGFVEDNRDVDPVQLLQVRQCWTHWRAIRMYRGF